MAVEGSARWLAEALHIECPLPHHRTAIRWLNRHSEGAGGGFPHALRAGFLLGSNPQAALEPGVRALEHLGSIFAFCTAWQQTYYTLRRYASRRFKLSSQSHRPEVLWLGGLWCSALPFSL